MTDRTFDAPPQPHQGDDVTKSWPACNCTESGLPYCGEAECDIDFCPDCGDEYEEPCARHAGEKHDVTDQIEQIIASKEVVA